MRVIGLSQQVFEVAHPNVTVLRSRFRKVIAMFVVSVDNVFTVAIRIAVLTTFFYNQPLVVRLVSQTLDLLLLSVICPITL